MQNIRNGEGVDLEALNNRVRVTRFSTLVNN